MALQRGASPWRVSVWTRSEASLPAVRTALPGCRVSCDLKEAVEGVDLVVLCLSPQAIETSGDLLAGILPASVPVTDAGSVKARIVASLEAALGGRFIGAHPMAGSEQSGIAAARADLFDGALCILTPTADSDAGALDLVRRFWSDAGSRLCQMSPDDHDLAVARISHLPHALAAVLVQAALSNSPEIAGLAGSGFRDTTRVALGPEVLWKEILLDNREHLVTAIGEFQTRLAALKQALMAGDSSEVEIILREARNLREQPQP